MRRNWSVLAGFVFVMRIGNVSRAATDRSPRASKPPQQQQRNAPASGTGGRFQRRRWRGKQKETRCDA